MAPALRAERTARPALYALRVGSEGASPDLYLCICKQQLSFLYHLISLPSLLANYLRGGHLYAWRWRNVARRGCHHGANTPARQAEDIGARSAKTLF